MTSWTKMNENASPKLFDPESLGASFEEFAVDIVKGESELEFVSRWFRASTQEADLVIWSDSAKRIIKQQLCFFGQVVEWNPINGTRTGVVIEQEVVTDETDDDAGEDSVSGLVETIRFDSRAQSTAVDSAIRLLSSISVLSESDRSSLVYQLRESPRLHKKARERALKTWAPKAEEIISDRRPTFWSRMREWLLGT